MPQDFDLRRLEELGLNSSAPPGQLLFDGWLIRLLPGQAKRARSVNAVYPARRALAEKLGYCEALYKRHQLPAIFRITPFSEPSGLDAELERLGYPRFDTTAVEAMAIDPAQLVESAAKPMELVAWVEEVGRLRGSNAVYRRSHLERLQSVLLPLRPMVVSHDGVVVAVGLTIVEDGWAGLFDVVTDSAFRRQGFGDQLVQGLLKSAWAIGARQSYLQVNADNTPARTLYARYGFQEQYQYWYRGHAD
ncbi:MAG: GNAT family N-acetyltransferase [Burkholderiaceae bacterium]